MLKQKKQLCPVILLVSLVCLIGCATNRIILHPITDKDIRIYSDSDGLKRYDMSEYFFNEVLELKIDKEK